MTVGFLTISLTPRMTTIRIMTGPLPDLEARRPRSLMVGRRAEPTEPDGA